MQSNPPDENAAAHDVARLGQRILAGAEPRAHLVMHAKDGPTPNTALEAAAWLLTGLPVEQLSLRDVELLLHVYRAKCCVGLNAALVSVDKGAAMDAYVARLGGDGDAAVDEEGLARGLGLFVRGDVVLPGRWAHVRSADGLRMQDVLQLQKDGWF